MPVSACVKFGVKTRKVRPWIQRIVMLRLFLHRLRPVLVKLLAFRFLDIEFYACFRRIHAFCGGDYIWAFGPWSHCADGVRERDVWCQSAVTEERVPDSVCYLPDQPSATEGCPCKDNFVLLSSVPTFHSAEIHDLCDV